MCDASLPDATDTDATHTDVRPSQQTSPTPERPHSRRIRLHDMDHWCCSIIGTCLTHDDLLATARKRNVNIDAGTKMFDVHGFFVTQAGSVGPISKHLEKLLEGRYRGLVRRVARVDDPEDLVEFWNTSVSNGQVAGAYWALLSHRHVPEELRNRVFGEVHMMSHLLGGSTRKIVGAAAELQSRLERIEKQNKRSSVQAQEALALRDSEIAELKQALAETRAQVGEQARRSAIEREPSPDRASRLLLKQERALVAARTKARELEVELETAAGQLLRLRGEKTTSRSQVAEETCVPPRGLCGKAVLYLGGRKRATDLLQKEADSANIILHCHDGGVDHSVQHLDDLVERCDAVICPVNCINHQACLKAKQLCKRMNKPFLPIGSSGRGTFSRALDTLAHQFGAQVSRSAVQ